MKKDKRESTEAAELRCRAEELLRAKTTEAQPPLTETESRRLLHELEVQRIELEMQNAQLRQARDDAETALEKYTDLYDFAPVSYFTLDRDGVIHEANLTGAALLGIERSRLIGRRLGLLIGEDASSVITPFLGRVFAGRNKETCEVTLLDKSKQPLFVRIEAVAESKGDECRVAVIDISERKRAEEERMIIQQSRQAALGEMLGNITHHWRQPLNGVGLIIQELVMASESDGLSADHLKASVDNAMQIILSLSRTLNEFRNFFAPDNEKTRFRVNQVVAGTVSFVNESFKAQQIGIDVKSFEEPLVDGYQNEYSQVLLNILFNARDALSERSNGSALVTVSSFTEGGKAVVTITDNGGGINKDIMERIFEPYFTTKAQGKGTGVGLFMAKTIIEKNMGGCLTARNVDGGAEFRIEV
ncbi:MAG TPA: ATP-binding protein [Geobacteraceae bacterium]|nr:ATP-binding protein [Geobacteraceae bacterium]